MVSVGPFVMARLTNQVGISPPGLDNTLYSICRFPFPKGLIFQLDSN